MPPIEPAPATAVKKPPVNADSAHAPADKPVAPPTDSATTAGKLQGSVEMLNTPENVTKLPPGTVNELAKKYDQKSIGSDLKVAPQPNSLINKPGEIKQQTVATFSPEIEAKRLEAQTRKTTTAALADNPNNPPRTDGSPLTQAEKLAGITAKVNDAKSGVVTPPAAGSVEEKFANITAKVNDAKSGVVTPPASGSVEEKFAGITAKVNDAKSGVVTPPAPGSVEAKFAGITAKVNDAQSGVVTPPTPGSVEARFAGITAKVNDAKSGVVIPPVAGSTEARLANIAANANAHRDGVQTAPGATEAKLKTIGETAAAKQLEVANAKLPAANTTGDTTPRPFKPVEQPVLDSNVKPRPGKPAEQPVLDSTGKPRPGAEVVRPADTVVKGKPADTSVPLTATEKREQRAQVRADLQTERQAKRDAPTVVKADTPVVTPTQTRAEVIAAKKAERLAATADPTTDTTRVRKVVDPPITAPDTTLKGRPRADAPAVTDVVKPVKPVVQAPVDGDSTQRPNRRVPAADAVGDTTVGKPLKPERPLRPAEQGDIPKVAKPALPPGAEIPAVVPRRGDHSELPAGDTLTARRKAAGDMAPTAPLDPRQQRFLADIAKGNDPTKLQAFKDNFEKLSPQNRNTLMNMDGKQQLDVIAKMSRPVDHALDGKLPIAGDLAKLTGRQDLKIPGLDVADPANRKFLTDVNSRFAEMKLDGTNANMKVSDLLKGLDPQKVSALEKFLTTNNSSLDAGKLTLGQLDGTKLTQLMKGNFDMGLATGKQLMPQEAMQSLTRQFTAGDGTNTLSTLGRTLNNMGTPPGRLSELVSKSLTGSSSDMGMMPGRMGDFTARLNPLQELNIRNLIENSSKLGLDSGFSRMDFAGRGDLAGTAIGLSQIIGTTFGDSRGDFAVRGDLVRSHQGQGDSAALVAESAEASGGKSQEYISKLPIDATTGLPYDPATGKLLDPITGRPVGDRVSEEKKSQTKRDDEDEMDEKEKEKKKQKKDADQDADKAKQKAMLLILQAKKKREQELREKQLKDEKQKKEDETRVKYICKDGDTIQSVALKQLRDSRVAPLIYSINKEVIATKIVNGEQVPLLHAGLVIWLPSPKEIKEFRSKLVSSAGASAPTAEKFASAEDELAARFGAGWAAGKSPETADGQPQQPMSEVERKLMEDAMAEAKRRRENIEAALGPIAGGTTRGARADGEHLSYQVRLGDTLRSVATKHPSIGDVNLWRLLAEVNDLTTDVDSKGQPKAGLARGGKIKIPTAAEIAEYRQKIGSMAGQPMIREQRVAKNCPKCGRMTVQSASLCPCGHEFGIERETAGKDAGTIVLEAITEDVSKRDGARTEDLDSDPTPTTKVGPRTGDAAQPLESRESQERTKETAAYIEPEQIWATCKDFEPTCRLTKSALGWDAAEGKLIIHLQMRNDEQSEWFPIVEYEVYGSYSIRHTFVRQTRARKTVKIDLPAAAAMELGQNDLLANWNNYKTKYLLA